MYTCIYIYYQFVAMDRAVAVRVPGGIAKEAAYPIWGAGMVNQIKNGTGKEEHGGKGEII